MTASGVVSAPAPAGVGDVVLACAGLRKAFGERVAVDGVGFAIAEGETYGLLGPNGAGKTTTISMVAGLLEPDAGEVVVAGRPVTTTSVAAKAAIGYVPQELAVYPDLTAAENLRFFARLYGLSGAERRARVAEVLEVIGLSERAADRVKEFSGGMKRRLNIGIGLLHRPRLLILDEPTVGVDPQSRNAILESVADLAGAGLAVLYTTHYMEEAERLCDRVGIIDLGELKAEGTRRQLVALVGEHDRVTLSAQGDLGLAAELVGKLPAVTDATARGDGIDLVVHEARALLPELLATLASTGVGGQQRGGHRTRPRGGLPAPDRQGAAGVGPVRAALVIAGKDLRQRLRDRSAVLLGLVVPLGLAVVFKLVFGGIDTEGMAFPYAVADVDGGPVAASFVAEVLEPLAGDGLIELHAADSAAAARALVADGAADAAFVLPAGFSAAVTRGAAAELEVIGSVDAALGAQVAMGIAEGFAADLDAVRVAVAAAVQAQPGLGADAGAVAARAAAVPAPVWVEDVSATMRELSPTTYLAAGIAVFFLFFTVQFGVVSLLEERREGTLARLRAAPISPLAVLGGKLLTSFTLGVLSMTALVAATSVLLGARWGHPAGVAVLTVAGVAAATAVTALVASVARTPEQAGNAQAVIAVLLGLLGGAFFPIGQAGGVMATLSLATPHAWFLRGLGELAGGAGPAAALPAAAAILAFAAVVGGVALTRLGRAVQP